jgi:hypothetical protein
VEELGNTYLREGLVGCRFAPEMEEQFYSNAGRTDLAPLGIVPFDNQLLTLNLVGRNIFQLDANSPAYLAVLGLWDEILEKLG